MLSLESGKKLLMDISLAIREGRECDIATLVATWWDEHMSGDASTEKMREAWIFLDKSADLYPVLLSTKPFFATEHEKCAYRDFLLVLNTKYINKIGCDCGKKVDLSSDDHDLNYSHHGHPKFREWAWLHLPKHMRDAMFLVEKE